MSRSVDPGVEDVERQVAVEALRRLQRQQEADPAAPVVADQLHPLEAELVEDGEHVVGHVLLLVAARRRVATSRSRAGRSPAPGGRLGERRHQVPPLVPVLGPAVQTEDDVVALPRFGDVEVEPARPDPAVADALDLGKSLTPAG